MAKRQPRASATTSFLPRYTQTKVFLMWIKRVAPIHKLLCTNVLREVCQFFGPRPLLVRCRDEELTMFDPLRELTKKIDLGQLGLSFDSDKAGECILIDEEQIFICGGKKLHESQKGRSAYLLDHHQLHSLSNMRHRRYGHGLYYHMESRSVFVFGGFTETGFEVSCEQYKFKSNSWTSIPNMQSPKYFTSICGFKGKVFVGGYSKHALENTFTFPYLLPLSNIIVVNDVLFSLNFSC